ncbi:TolC family outer membrane protein [Janthinobacterium sp. 17J80-10]|uniref:TolC family outer membrane protein n=1 Tax=Janthinobacterium sp. 17J80-10 TaxID=2497863 RepID=UPI0013E8F47C|nr:TolC family outer membrane protein [Janthinobacterium sp. 17J80-10]
MSSWQAARTHDARFAAAEQARNAGLENANLGAAAMLPQIALNGNAGQTASTSDSVQANPAAPPTRMRGPQYEVGVTLIQPLYDAAATVGRDQLKLQARQAAVQYRAEEQDLILRVAKAYCDTVLAQENLKLVAAQKEAVGQQLAQAKKMLEVGSSSITDANEAQARFDAIIAIEIAARNDLATKSDVYKTLTDLDPAQLAPVSEEHAATILQPASLGAWMLLAQESNLALQAQQLGLDHARQDIDRYRLESAPAVSLVASYGRKWDGSIAAAGAPERKASGAIGLQLSIPLYTGGGRSAQLRQAVAVREQQRHTLEAVRRDAVQGTRQFFLAVESGTARIKALEQAQVSSASWLASIKRGREVGAKTTVDVIDAEQNVYQARYNLVEARYQFLLNRLQLAAAVGKLNEAELANVNGWLAARE